MTEMLLPPPAPLTPVVKAVKEALELEAGVAAMTRPCTIDLIFRRKKERRNDA